MRSWTIAAILSVAAGLGVAEAAGPAYQVDPNHSEVTFQVRHLVGKVRGRFTEFAGHIDADKAAPSVEFKIKAASVDTAVPDRDKHLRSADFFDVDKFPEITFKSDKVVSKGKDDYEAQGTLTMHGVSKPVTLAVHVTGPAHDPWGNDRAGFEVLTSLNRKDFGIVWNKALDAGGFMLGDDVAISINLEAVSKPADAAAAPPAPKPAK